MHVAMRLLKMRAEAPLYTDWLSDRFGVYPCSEEKEYLGLHVSFGSMANSLFELEYWVQMSCWGLNTEF